MVAYEFYVLDEMEEFHSIGILSERRKDPLRITPESIIKWGKMVAGDDADLNSIFFIQVTLNESTGGIFWSKPSFGLPLEG
jgi:hypothetical protein